MICFNCGGSAYIRRRYVQHDGRKTTKARLIPTCLRTSCRWAFIRQTISEVTNG